MEEKEEDTDIFVRNAKINYLKYIINDFQNIQRFVLEYIEFPKETYNTIKTSLRLNRNVPEQELILALFNHFISSDEYDFMNETIDFIEEEIIDVLSTKIYNDLIEFFISLNKKIERELIKYQTEFLNKYNEAYNTNLREYSNSFDDTDDNDNIPLSELVKGKSNRTPWT